MEFKLNGKIYCKLQCEKCGNEFIRRKDEFKKHLIKCNKRILCSDCMRARKYEDITKKVCSKCHKEQINEYKRNYYYNNKNDLLYVFKIRTRCLVQRAFKRKGYKKTSKTQEILGCNYKTFIEHLLQTFKDNYGYEWDTVEKVHIDHIIPLSNAKTKEEVLRLNNYKNLQLLKELDNLHKSNKLNWSIKE